MTCKKTFKVEVVERKTPEPSNFHWDFSADTEGVRILDIMYSKIPKEKKTGKYNYYVYMTITRNTEQECYDEFDGQMSDGFFENYPLDDIGEVWEVL